MSGTQGPMPPPAGGGAPPQLPPQVLQMLMQRMQQGGAAPGGGQPMMPPPGAGAPMAPPGQAGGTAGGMPPTGPSPLGQPHLTPAQMAAEGRFGDSVVAHLTPGEVQVPPQVQTPHLMHVLQQAFAKAGVSPAQFTAGSGASSHNPATGAPEYSLLAALLPILGGAAGSFIPGLGTGLGAAIGGGLGGAAGGMIDKTGGMNTALSALGGAAGGYLAGGGGLNPASAPMQGPTLSGAPLDATPFGGTPPSAMGALRTGMGAGLGSAVGGMLTPPNQDNSAASPPGFNNPMPPLNRNFNALLGNGQSSHASFNGYNPFTAATGQPYNIYSPTGNGA